MVFITSTLMARMAKHTNQFFGKPQIGPDRFWGRRKAKMMSAHFYGRPRNCYRLSIRVNLKQMEKSQENRKLVKRDAKDLWDCRIEGVANTLNYNTWHMRESLSRSGILLDRHMLANLAITEPRTFRAVTAIAANKTSQSTEDGGLGLHSMGPGPEIDIIGKI